MVEREKVIKGLECCTINNHGDCPYDDEKDCSETLLFDALHILTTPNTDLPGVDYEDALEQGKVIGYQQAVLEMSIKLKGMKINGGDNEKERATGMPGV